MLLKAKPIKKEPYTRPEFLPYVHFLRGFAILLIVGIHCRTSFQWQPDSMGQLFFEATLDNGTIIFVFIAGFLFEHLFTRNFNFLSYFNKKLKYVVGPYILVSIVPILDKLYFEDNLIWLPNSLINQPDIIKAAYMIVTGKQFGPYWFIPMIVVFYVISPLLVRINNPKFYTYIFPFIFIGGLFTYKFGYYSNTWDSFIYFLPIYLFGMAVSYYKESIIAHKNKLIYIFLSVYFVVTVLEIIGYIPMYKLTTFEILRRAEPLYVFNFTKLKVSFFCIALLLIFYKMNNRKMPILKILGDYSFGIYFVHLYFIVIIQFIVHSLINSFHITSILFILYTLLVTCLSIGSVHIFKKIFGRNSRYVIGS